MGRPVAPAVLDLLLLTRGLIDHARGDVRANLQRAWGNAMRGMAAEQLDGDGKDLPQSPAAASKELIVLVLQLAKAHGVTGVELPGFFNEIADSGALIVTFDPDTAIRRGFALLGVVAAQRMDAEPHAQAQEIA